MDQGLLPSLSYARSQTAASFEAQLRLEFEFDAVNLLVRHQV